MTGCGGVGEGVMFGVVGWSLASTGSRKGVIWKNFTERGVCGMGERSMSRHRVGGFAVGPRGIRVAVVLRGL